MNKILVGLFATATGIASGVITGTVVTYSVIKSTYKNFVTDIDDEDPYNTWSDAIKQGLKTDLVRLVERIRK